MQLAVHRWGSGPRVVLVHGGGAPSRETWYALKPLSERWELVAVDRPGHGDSPGDRNDFELDAVLLAEQALSEPSHVVGYSYGSIGCMLAAAQVPQAVRSLTVIEPPTPTVAEPTPEIEAWSRELAARVGTPAEPRDLIDWFFPFIGVPLPTPDPMPQWLVRGAQALAAGRSPTEAVVPVTELRRADFPMMVVSGGHDPCQEAICNALADRTGARRETVGGWGHLIPSAGEPLNRLLEELWRGA